MARLVTVALFLFVLVGAASRAAAQAPPDIPVGTVHVSLPSTDAAPAPARTSLFQFGRLDFAALRPWFQAFSVPTWRMANVRTAPSSALRERRAAGVR